MRLLPFAGCVLLLSAACGEAQRGVAPSPQGGTPMASAVAQPPGAPESLPDGPADAGPAPRAHAEPTPHESSDRDDWTVWRTLSGRVRRCYEKSLAKRPGLRVVVRLRFTLTPSGRISAINADLDPAHDELRACIEERVKAMLFPEVNSEMIFELTFHLKP